MAKQRIVHGSVVDFATPDEIYKAIPRPREVTRIRQTAQIALSAAGAGQVEVYKIPAGYEFAARRVTVYLGGQVDPTTGSVPLTGAGKGIQYLRSGAFIEWAQPQYGSTVQVPGVQTWGDQQGPYLRNAEVFEIAAIGLTASAMLNVVLEGLLQRPPETNHA